MTANETLRSSEDGLTHANKLLNLLCIVYSNENFKTAPINVNGIDENKNDTF